MNLKNLLIPAAIILITIFYSPQVGSILMIGYIAYVVVANLSSVYAWLAVRKYHKADLAGAEKWFGKAAESKKAGGTTLLSYALVLLKTGKFDEAERVVDRAAELELNDYNSKVVVSMRGLLEWKQGDPRAAAAELGELAEDFENTTLFGCLGSLYLAEGMNDAAWDHNQKAYEFNDSDPKICDNMARTHYLRGDVETAEDMWRSLTDRDVPRMEPYLNLALLLEERADDEDACKMAEAAHRFSYSHLSYFSEEEVNAAFERLAADEGT